MAYLIRINIICALLLSVVQLGAQNVPQQTFYRLKVEEYVTGRPEIRQPIHLSVQPFRKSQIGNFDTLIRDTNQYKTWFGRKLFKESIIDFDHKKFHVIADPIINFRGGRENPDTSSKIMFQNTRGFRIAGSIGSRFSFESRFYENQARFPDFLDRYFRSRGERYPAANRYQTQNAVIAGNGRTKPFKNGAFDYASVMGYITVQPLENWHVSAGHDMNFIGNGYRSLLLSDNSFYGPFVRSDLTFFDQRLKLTNIYQGLLNLNRFPESTTPESTYEKKWGTFHYLDYAFTPWLTMGFFEGIVWKRSDSLGTKPFPYESLNPAPFINSSIYGLDNQNNAIIGLNIQVIPWKHFMLYGQLMFDDFKKEKYGFQLGWKFFNVFKIDNLFLGTEYNYISKGTYAKKDARNSYSHYNLPLAHPKGSGFQEIILRARYHTHRIFCNYKANIYITQESDSLGIATNDIFNVQKQGEAGKQKLILNQKLELGYRFNPMNNLQVYTGFQHRISGLDAAVKPETFYFYVGIRTSMKNFYDDI